MKRGSKKFRRANTTRGRLTAQRLESRNLMAADIGLSDSVLSIQGSDQHDIAEVYVESDRVHVRVSSYDESCQVTHEQNEEFALEDVGQIVFTAGDGDDLFVNDSAIPAIARGGSGNDMLLGGTGSDVMIGGSGDDTLLGGGGDDVLLGGPGQNQLLDAVAPAEHGSGDASEVDDSASDATASDASDDASVDDPPAATVELTQPDADGLTEDASAIDGETLVETTVEVAEVADTSSVVSEGATEQTEETQTEEMQTEEMQTEEVAGSRDDGGETGDRLDAVELVADVDDAVVDDAVVDDAVVGVGQQQVDPILDDGSDATDSSSTVGELEDTEDTAVISDTEIIEVSGEANADDGESENLESDHDVIFGGAGDDWIMGEGGNDLIFGGVSPIEDALLRQVIAGRLRL